MSDSEDSDFQSDGDEDDEEDGEKDDGELKLTGRQKWMKIEALIAIMPQYEQILRKKKGNERARVQKKVSKVVKESKLEQDKESRKAQAAASAWLLDKNVTEDMLDKKLKEIIASRGRKGTNVKETIRALEVLAKAARAHGPRKEIPVLMYLIAALFDAHKSIDEYMELHDWRTAYRYMTRIINVLDRNRSIVLGVMDEEDITDIMLGGQPKKGFEEGKDDTVKSIGDSLSGVIKIVGSVDTFLNRLDEEYTKSLQQINPHTQVSSMSIIRPAPFPLPLSSGVIRFFNAVDFIANFLAVWVYS